MCVVGTFAILNLINTIQEAVMIIDTHVHIGNSLNFIMTEEDVLYSMKTYGIDYCMVSNCEAASHDHSRVILPNEYQTSAVDCLKRVLRFCKENEGKIGAAVWVKPSVEKPSKELVDLIEENRKYIHAIKLHPYHAGCSFSSEEAQEYIKLARDLSLPVVTHTGDCEDDSPQRVYEMAKKYPEVNFVMVHLGLGTDNKEAIKLCAELPNLYGDTTWVSVDSALEFIKACGAEKLLFGSDNPIDGKDTYLNNGKGDVSLYQDYFTRFRETVGEEVYSLVMAENAKRLFKINI